MEWNEHRELLNSHALLSPSKYHWINYDENKLMETYENFRAAERGTKLHEFASMCIQLGQRLPRDGSTLSMFVNDVLRFGLRSEQPLYFSRNCYGTADAIGFDGRKLRIFDLKTGKTPAHMEQLKIYAALFCLEYAVDPARIRIELRIYQSGEVDMETATPEEIEAIRLKIIRFDRLIQTMNEKE